MKLTGLRGDSLLGFLAALGVCRLTRGRLAWDLAGGPPVAVLDSSKDPQELVGELFEACKLRPAPVAYEPQLERAFKVTREEWRKFAANHPDWAVALGSDAGKDVFRSPLLMSSGGGHQHALTTIDKLALQIDELDIQTALFGPWRRHAKLGLRYDPGEDRTHADAWANPSDATAESEVVPWGATRLAFEGLVLIPTLAVGQQVISDQRGHRFAWPVWEQPLTPRAVTARIIAAEPSYECKRFTRPESKGNWSVTAASPVGR